MASVTCRGERRTGSSAPSNEAILRASQYQNHREITLLVVHCSATRCDRDYSFETCREDHIRNRGFADIGYHFYITRDGRIHRGRSLDREGAHARGWNRHSIGICYEGGLDPQGRPADTRTAAQRASLTALLARLRTDYPDATTVGHRDLPGVNKACPCYDVLSE